MSLTCCLQILILLTWIQFHNSLELVNKASTWPYFGTTPLWSILGAFTGQFQANLQTNANVDFSTSNRNASLILCIQEFVQPPYYKNLGNCTYSFLFGGKLGNLSKTLPFRNINYSFSLFFKNTSQINFTMIDFSFSGANCLTGGTGNETIIYDEKQLKCRKVDKALKIGVTNVDFIKDEPKFFVVNIKPNTAYFSISTNVLTKLYIRYESTPSSTLNDGNSTIISPLPGQWIVSITSEISSNISIKLIINQCFDINLVGPNCSLTSFKTSKYFENLTKIISPYQYHYYTYNSSDGPVWVTVKSANSTNPLIMVSYGQIPSIGNSIISACNAQYCEQSAIIQLSNESTWGQNGTWYVGVYSNVSQVYGIWFNKHCPANCKGNRGTCLRGACVCRYGWIGLDCYGYNGLSEKMISVVIISVLLGISAVLAFFTFLFMANHTHYYENL